MKFVAPLLAVIFASIQTCVAQIAVTCSFDQKAYLANEELVVKVRISNSAGRTLTMGTNPDWLFLSVEALDGYIVSQYGMPPVVGEFELPNAKYALKRVNIEPYFAMKPGRYNVVATVKVPGWEKPFVSPPVQVDIVSGTRLWEKTFGLPMLDENGEPGARRYILQKAHQGKDMQLYLRLTDGDGAETFRVFSLGTMVSFTNPEMQMDGKSRLHVLHQTGSRAFSYSVVAPNGQTLKKERHDYTETRPTLRVNREGEIFVVGGVRRSTTIDRITPPKAAEQPAASEQDEKIGTQ